MSSRWIEGCSRGLGCRLRRSIRLAHVCSPASKTQLSLFFSFSARPPITFFAEPSAVFKLQPQGCGLALVPVGNKNSWSLRVCVLPSHKPSVFSPVLLLNIFVWQWLSCVDALKGQMMRNVRCVYPLYGDVRSSYGLLALSVRSQELRFGNERQGGWKGALKQSQRNQQ